MGDAMRVRLNWGTDVPRPGQLLTAGGAGAAQPTLPLAMPLRRPLSGGLWEVRASLPNGNMARVLFCIAEGTIIALSGFIEKTQETPPRGTGFGAQAHE